MGTWSSNLANTKPINLIRIRDVPDSLGRTFIVNEEEIRHYLLASNIRNIPVVVISVAGVARTGKSFFLTFLLRYAVIKYQLGSKDDWLGDEEIQMGGFEFAGSIAMKTNGIVMWPHLFECTTGSKKKICILLIDTQGTYDGQGASTIWATVFALSVMVSSLQIYNIEEEISEDDLQSLELDLGFVRLLPDHFAGKKPAQRLMFLVRDFKLRDDYKCGLDGGNNYLREKVFNDEMDQMHQEVRDNISTAFEDIECCTLPYPGRAVVESKHFSGKLQDIDTKFKNTVASVVEDIFNADNLTLKRVHGEEITVEKLYNHILELVHSLNFLHLPTVVSPLRALADNHHEEALEAAVVLYVTIMEASGCTSGFIDPRKMESLHEDSLDRAMKLFQSTSKLGGGELITPHFATRLHNILLKKYDEYTIQNAARIACVYNELPIWTIISLVLLTLAEGWMPVIQKVTLWIKLIIMGKLLIWIRRFSVRWIFDEQ